MARFRTSSPKRHPSLQPLSRDHQLGLAHCRHLLKAARGTPAQRREALAQFLEAWEREISLHFDDEEWIVSPLADETLRKRLRLEHDRIRAMADQVRGHAGDADPDAAWVTMLAQALVDHIRWEERELFPLIESSACDALDTLRFQADEIEASRTRETPSAGA